LQAPAEGVQGQFGGAPVEGGHAIEVAHARQRQQGRLAACLHLGAEPRQERLSRREASPRMLVDEAAPQGLEARGDHGDVGEQAGQVVGRARPRLSRPGGGGERSHRLGGDADRPQRNGHDSKGNQAS
jgi:hypothetical protein